MAPEAWHSRLGDELQDVGQHSRRGLIRIDLVDEFVAVKIQDGLGLGFVRFQPVADDGEVGVIEAIFLDGPALDAGDEFFLVGILEVKDGDDVEGIAQDFGLGHIAGNAVQDEGILFRMEPAAFGSVFDELAPELDGGLIGDELAAAGIFDEELSEGAIGAQITKNIAAGAMEVVRNNPENLALGSLARTGGAE